MNDGVSHFKHSTQDKEDCKWQLRKRRKSKRNKSVFLKEAAGEGDQRLFFHKPMTRATIQSVNPGKKKLNPWTSFVSMVKRASRFSFSQAFTIIRPIFPTG